jgi:hypothetical protein
MKWIQHITHMEEMEGYAEFWIENLTWRNILRFLGIDNSDNIKTDLKEIWGYWQIIVAMYEPVGRTVVWLVETLCSNWKVAGSIPNDLLEFLHIT